MFDPIVTTLIFVAVIAITAILFGGWLVVIIAGAIGRLLMLPFRGQPEPPRLIDGVTALPRCVSARCRAENPAVASFCRRCGTPMRAAEQMPARRVAMW